MSLLLGIEFQRMHDGTARSGPERAEGVLTASVHGACSRGGRLKRARRSGNALLGIVIRYCGLVSPEVHRDHFGLLHFLRILLPLLFPVVE